ncbi:MFS transporter [Paenibacillus hexagrammi]|uniref:MFS transporter n=1 Tax=Paenibacillus hexagrammi TaxID=2908839 RepID=A0ABY3SJL7_9BACL|nr:MFS transporter [Paenibacillus sp. YPD9-1]UJF34037.1 MFS transporter [Paenibacillus sp. YPD9-1]
MTDHALQVSHPSTPRYSMLTAIFVWCALVVVSGLYVTLPMGPVLAGVFHVSPADAAWTSSAFSLAYALGFLVFGPLSDRFGRWPMMFFGLLALFIITPLLGLAPSLSVLVALRALQGLASATFAPSVIAYVVERFPAERRVTAVGFISTGFLVSAIAGQLFSSAVSEYWGWNYVFYLHGGFVLISALLLGKLIPRGHAFHTKTGLAALYKQLPEVFLYKPLTLCYLICVTVLLSLVGMYTIFGSYLMKAPFELTAAQLLQVRAMGLIGMVLSPFAGQLVAKFGMKTVLQAGLLLAAAGLGFIGFCTSLPVLIVVSILYIAGISVIIPTLISLVGMLAGARRGAAVTVYSLVLFIGASVGPLIALNALKTGSGLAAFEALAMLLLIAFGVSCFIRVSERTAH